MLGRRSARHTGHNARLQAGWAGSIFPRAGELLRHLRAGWPQEQQLRFQKMLRQVFLPMVPRARVAPTATGSW